MMGDLTEGFEMTELELVPEGWGIVKMWDVLMKET